jgi:hypothetical protein
LGQIPLYWRDRVLRIGCEDHNALIDSMAALQVAHLKALEQDNKAWSIVISDTEYYFYHVDSAQWRVEPALFGVAADTFKASIANLDSEAWLWHIAPQFVENDLEGEIHRVEAYFSRSPSAYP